MFQVVTSAFLGFFKKLFLASVTQKFIEWVFFKCAEALVKETNNTMDDEAVAKIKELYFAKKD